MTKDAITLTGQDTSCWLETGYTLAAAAGVALFCATFLLRDSAFYWHDDFQTAFLPNYCDIARALSKGEFPLRSPFSWQGGAFGGVYEYGIFSVWLLGCIAGVFALGVSLPVKAAVLSILHLAVLASGAFRLARRRGLDLAESGLAVLAASLNGWIFTWGAMDWFGHLAAFAWLPWAWWALERAVEQREGACRFLPAGLFLYLLLAAGWPFAVLMAGMVSLWLALRNGRSLYGFVCLWPMAAAWIMGLGLSAPAWLMLLEFTPHTMRGTTPLWQLNREWVVPLNALPALVFPPLVAEWTNFDGREIPHRFMELTGGLVPVVVLAAALCRLRRTFLRWAGWEFGLAGFLLLLCLVPTLGNFRWSFRWLPFFFVALGLAAAQALALFRQSGTSLPRLGLWATVAVFVAWMTTSWHESVSERFTYVYALFLLSCCLVWGWMERRNPASTKLRGALPCIVTLAACWLSYANPGNILVTPTWPLTAEPLRDLPLDSEVHYFAAYRYHDIYDSYGQGIGSDLYPGNSALLGGIHLVNGYSAMRPAGLATLLGLEQHGPVVEKDIPRILSRETEPDGLLALMAVDGLILARYYESFVPQLEQRGWRVASSTEEALVLHRQGPASPRVRVLTQAESSPDRQEILHRLRGRPEGPLPLLLSASSPREGALVLGSAEVEITKKDRNSLVLEVRNGTPDRPVLVAMAQPWYPGYKARFNGQPVPVQVLDLIMPAVLLPAGAQGQLIVEYRPDSFVYGWKIALGTLLGVLLFCAAALRSKQHELQPGIR